MFLSYKLVDSDFIKITDSCFITFVPSSCPCLSDACTLHVKPILLEYKRRKLNIYRNAALLFKFKEKLNFNPINTMYYSLRDITNNKYAKKILDEYLKNYEK